MVLLRGCASVVGCGVVIGLLDEVAALMPVGNKLKQIAGCKVLAFKAAGSKEQTRVSTEMKYTATLPVLSNLFLQQKAWCIAAVCKMNCCRI